MGRISRITGLLGVLFATLAVAGASTAAASAMPTEGVFESCPLATAFVTCVSRLSAMSAGGVQVVVMNPRSASLDELTQYAASARGQGISVMWSIGLPDWWQQPLDSPQLGRDMPQFAAACGCNTNQALFAYFVGWLAALPATYGYYAADDTATSPAEEPAIAAYMARLKQLDPVHPAMIGYYGGGDQSNYQSMADLVGQEIYPVSTSPILPANANQSTWANVASTAAGAQSIADGAGKSSAFILQAFSWGDNLSDGTAIGACSASDTLDSCYAKLRYPAAAEQLALRNAVLSNAHPSLILWWSFPGTYGSAVVAKGTIYPSGADAASRWSGLSSAIQAPWSRFPAAADTAAAQPSPAPAAVHHRSARRHRHRKYHPLLCRARSSHGHHRGKLHRCTRQHRRSARARGKHVRRAPSA